ncbi:MAG: DNA polymerase IV [Planctomycetota bacterium]
MREILHVDMDAFFAAVEQLDRPELRGQPVIVGGTPEGHGVVSTASYEARKFGVHSAMPAARAVKLCPDGIFVRPRMGRYVEMSKRVFEVFRSYSPLVEGLSIDEAFIDVTGSHLYDGKRVKEGRLGVAIARELQARVTEATGGLTCSVGVAHNKFLAKLASDLRKPAGLTVVPQDGVREFLGVLPVRRLWGVGPKTEEKLHLAGIRKVSDVQRLKETDVERMLGRELGQHIWRLAHGMDRRSVTPGRAAKSISQERTFGTFIPVGAIQDIEREMLSMAEQVAFRLRKSGLFGRVVQIKVRDEKFRTQTRSQTLDAPSCFVEEIFPVAKRLFHEKVNITGREIRLLGVGVGQLVEERSKQLDFFGQTVAEDSKTERVTEALDSIRERLGHGAITRGSLLRPGPKPHRQDPPRGS